MRRLAALVLVAVLLVGVTAPAAYAGGNTGTNVALGLASFAVFNQLLAPLLYQRHAYAEPYQRQAYAEPVTVTRSIVYTTPVVYTTPAVYAVPTQVVAVQPAPPQQTVVQYAHGRYELRGDGVYHAYQWVWIPNAPPPPPPPPY